MLAASQYHPPALKMTGSVSAHLSAENDLKGQGLAHKYRVVAQGAVDGNTVEMDVERAQFAENTLRYKFALQMASEEANEMGGMLRSIAK